MSAGELTGGQITPPGLVTRTDFPYPEAGIRSAFWSRDCDIPSPAGRYEAQGLNESAHESCGAPLSADEPTAFGRATLRGSAGPAWFRRTGVFGIGVGIAIAVRIGIDER